MGNKETIEEVSPMTDLLKDLIQTKLKVKESIDLITNEFLASQINKFVQHTLDVIIERIENELLETESKFQQEKSYSEEEVMDMFHNLSMHLPLHYEFLVKEQFKKK